MGLKRRRISRKVATAISCLSNDIHVAAFFAHIHAMGYTAQQMMFVDESHTDARNSNRKYGYAKIGLRAEMAWMSVRGARHSLLLASNFSGIMAYDIIANGCSQVEFDYFIINEVGPACRA